MADFREAFLQGLAAYEEAEQARKEIFGLLDEFAEQVHQASNGRVRIERTSVKAREKLPLASDYHNREYEAIVALGSSGDEREELCEYSLAERGYPVTLRYAKEDVRCHDGQALERGLQKLLAHPQTGGKLRRLLEGAQAA